MTLNRRKFLTQSGQSLAVLPVLKYNAFNNTHSAKNQKPKKLTHGNTIALISPSGAVFNHEPINIAIEALEKFGLKVQVSKFLKSRYGHLAGTDEERAAEVNEMFDNTAIHGIICLRGGSGAARILDKLDYNTIRKNPKVFIGYSDITALQLAIYKKTGLVTFHGPVGLSSWDEFSRSYFTQLLFDNELMEFKNPEKPEHQWVQTENRIRVIHPGTVRGRLIGGNLSVLCGLLGSDYVPGFKGSILFLEEVNEALYRVDRLMSQLYLSGILKDIKGFIFGKCTRCDPDRGYGSLTFDEIIDHYIKPLKIPAFSGSMIGHIQSKFTVPIGVEAELNANKGMFQLVTSALNE
ncbi:LD-carboxypeptidase [Fulvivirga sp. M361]|uniref:S66 peptidase family protein n=1 Tax=Fulvivirga sp. M361 TaxID=2594266 RepID=UPI00117BC3C8|nr:LD-carboxypeptidase [Fulvivirga sp. M361]TRX53015.1 LD-carboxypeptidase [Fulvivirga sp. M361]